MTESLAVQARDVTVALDTGAPIVQEVSFQLRSGEILGLVGESGSGKTTLALTTLGYARRGARIRSGRVIVAGEDMLGLTETKRRARRGSLVGYVPQDPGAALNPALRVESLLAEMLRAHDVGGDWSLRIGAVLEKVGLPSDGAFRRRFPHQLSGGQQQRVAIALALVCEPAVLIMDEPTTGLDVITQSRVLAEVKRVCQETGVAIVYVSHDLAVVAGIADRIAVMYSGRIVEQGATEELLLRPFHPYTLGLIASIPDHLEPRVVRGIPGVAPGLGGRGIGCAFAPRCSLAVADCSAVLPKLEEVSSERAVRCLRWRDTPRIVAGGLRAFERSEVAPLLAVQGLRAVHRSRAGAVVAADHVSFMVGVRECVALVGESGSGKTTIARCIAGLHPRSGGEVVFDGAPVPALARDRPREMRRRIQIVFQNPYDSLNPKLTVQQCLSRPLRLFRTAREGYSPEQRVAGLLDQVSLPAGLARRYPAELSGGERQRVAIARALAASPDLLICDEITSALDVSVQAAVLELLATLRRDLGLALMFISHDLGVVSTLADRVLVLDNGRICEHGEVRRVLATPTDGYTRRLIEAAPSFPRQAPEDAPARL